MKKKHKIADAIKHVCEKKETGTLVVITDDNQFATFSLIKGEIVSIGYQGQYGVEAIESVASIELGVCRFRRDKMSSRRDALPSTEDIIAHFLQYNQKAKAQPSVSSVDSDTQVEEQEKSKDMLIDTLSIEQKRIFETCLAEYIGAMAPILTEEYLEIESNVESAVNSLMLIVRNMSGMEDAKKFNQTIVEQLKATGLNDLASL